MKSNTYTIGDKIEFDNGLIKSIATIKDISRKKKYLTKSMEKIHDIF